MLKFIVAEVFYKFETLVSSKHNIVLCEKLWSDIGDVSVTWQQNNNYHDS